LLTYWKGRAYAYEELNNRDKASLDIFLLRDERRKESDSLLDPDISPRKASKTSKPPSNNRRYLNWLGQQLGFKRPEDWARLRAADVLRHRGKGLLKQFQFRIAPIVREYLGY
jgi:hypothetical protein